MWEFVQQLTVFQWVMIIAGGMLAYPLIFKPGESESIIPRPSPQPKLADPDAELVNIVKTWSLLRVACKKAGLKEAEVQLLEVFPLLVKDPKTK